MTTRRPLVLAGGIAAQMPSGDVLPDDTFPAIRAFTEQGSDPATPASGTLDVYAKTDHKLYTKDSTGAVTQVGAGQFFVGGSAPTPDATKDILWLSLVSGTTYQMKLVPHL